MNKREQKWYNKNEAETMRSLGLTPTVRSGAGWIEKEDGYNEKIIAQLKSTDANSYRVSIDDINKLEYHAMVDKKKPLFVIQFIDRGTYLMIRKEDLKDVCLSIYGVEQLDELGYDSHEIINELMSDEISDGEVPKKIIKCSRDARDKFMREREQKWQQKKK